MQVNIGINPAEQFADADWCLMIGAKPRGPGMERADLLQQNGEIFQIQVGRHSAHLFRLVCSPSSAEVTRLAGNQKSMSAQTLLASDRLHAPL